MSRLPVDPQWFRELGGDHSHPPEWLLSLRPSVENVVSFGCMSDEPFFLLWTLDAAEVKVVEIRPETINIRQEKEAYLKRRIPLAFRGRTIDFIPVDMLELGEEFLPTNCCDLAFCKRVLYDIFLTHLGNERGEICQEGIQRALERIADAIRQMERVVKPGGYIIVVESIAMVAGGEPIPIHSLFAALGLVEIQLDGAPKEAYCYTKPIWLSGYITSIT